jgi:hypothetical protein
VLDLALHWPDIEESDDITDWFARAGGTAERLREMVAGTPDWAPPEDGQTKQRSGNGKATTNADDTISDWCIAVAVGGQAMGAVQCEQGDVLYLCLEDNRRRVKHRINVVRPYSDTLGGLERLSIRTRAPKIGEGLLEELE